MSTLKGKVKWFNGKKGYGFIEREDGEKDCFVHASAVREAGLRFLNENEFPFRVIAYHIPALVLLTQPSK